jgi:hypothetical protein
MFLNINHCPVFIYNTILFKSKHDIFETGFCLCLHVKSKLVQYVYAEGHKISRNEAKVLKIELNTTYRKPKEFPHVFDKPFN